MTSDAFKQGLSDMYQGEVIGEVALNEMLSWFDEPVKRYKIAVILQLESETKARLRPALMALGIDITEQEESRETGRQFAAALSGLEWKEAMAALRDGVRPYLDSYREIAAAAPAAWHEIAQSMVVHEQSLHDFAEMEAAGDTQHSLDAVNAQLAYPLPKP